MPGWPPIVLLVLCCILGLGALGEVWATRDAPRIRVVGLDRNGPSPKDLTELHQLGLDFLQQAEDRGPGSPGVGAGTIQENTWAVLVGASRYWYNYRHSASTLSLYRRIRALGVPDSRILLMLADDVSCNPRNARRGRVFDRQLDQLRAAYSGDSLVRLRPASASPFAEPGEADPHWSKAFADGHRDEYEVEDGFREANLYLPGIEVDYRGAGCSVENLLRALTGRLTDPAHSHQQQRQQLRQQLASDAHSRLLVYLTGHGGDGFLKFHDQQELTAEDLGRALRLMWLQRRFARALVLVDTCQAATINEALSSPRTVGVGSSARGENSYSRENDPQLGVTLADRFSFALARWLDRNAFGDGASGSVFPGGEVGTAPPPTLHRSLGVPAESPASANAKPHQQQSRASSLGDFLGSLSHRDLHSSIGVHRAAEHAQQREDWRLLRQQLQAAGAAARVVADVDRVLPEDEGDSVHRFELLGFFRRALLARVLPAEYPLCFESL